MMLFIDGIQAGVHQENVGYYIQDYESGFDLLTQLVADHWTLESAIIADDYDCVSLPIEAFDGQSMREHISALQQQWNDLLTTEPVRPVPLPRLKNWYLHLEKHYGMMQTRLEERIYLWRIRINKLKNRSNEPFSAGLISQYQLWLESTNRIYEQTVTYRQQNWQRLQMLEEDPR